MRKLALAFVPLFLLACDRQPVAPAAEHAQAFNFMNNPDNGNPQIWRNDYAAAYRWFDGTLRMTVTTYPINNQGVCGPNSVLDTWEWQDLVFGPDWTDPMTRLIENGQAYDVWIIVDDVATPGGCFVTAAFPGGGTLVAQGMGQARNNDNDLWGPYGDVWTNSWGTRAQGALTTPSGARVMVSGHTHCTYSERNGNRGCQTQITVQ